MAKNSMDLLEPLRKRGLEGDVDFLREALQVLVEGIIACPMPDTGDAEVSSQIGAQHGERNPERVTHRNGYRSRDWDTQVGTMELRIPKLREESYFPTLLEPRRRGEKALLAVIQQAYAGGVHQEGGRPDQVPGLRRHLQEPGLAHLPGPGSGGGDFPGKAPGRWPVSLRVAARVDPEGQGRWPHRERQRGSSRRRERPGSAGDFGHGRGNQRGRRLLAGLPALTPTPVAATGQNWSSQMLTRV